MTITIESGRDLRIARLFNVLWHGEHIACAIAMRQGRACREPKARRFFALQATQEALHAAVFHAAAVLLAPRGRSLRTPAIVGTRLLAASEELFGYGLSTAASYDAQLRATLPEALMAAQP